VLRSGVRKVPLPSILKTIARDATYYFLVIFTSHIVLVMFLASESVSTSSYSIIFSLRLAYTFLGYNQASSCCVSDARTFLPFVRSPECLPRNSGTLAYVGHLFAFRNIASDSRLRFVPMMITRLLLSLKKAGAPREHGWSLGEPTTHTAIKFAERRVRVTTGDEISLDTFASTYERTRSYE